MLGELFHLLALENCLIFTEGVVCNLPNKAGAASSQLQVPNCLLAISPKTEEHTWVRLTSKQGRGWLQHQAVVRWKAMRRAMSLSQASRTCSSHLFEMRAFQVLNADGQSVLASCEETSSSPCPPKPWTKALSSLHTIKFLWLSQMLHVR